MIKRSFLSEGKGDITVEAYLKGACDSFVACSTFIRAELERYAWDSKSHTTMSNVCTIHGTPRDDLFVCVSVGNRLNGKSHSMHLDERNILSYFLGHILVRRLFYSGNRAISTIFLNYVGFSSSANP